MSEKLAKKLIELETSYGLLQHSFEQQNEMIVQNTRHIQAMEMTIKRLLDQITGLQSAVGPDRTAEDEKPPHY